MRLPASVPHSIQCQLHPTRATACRTGVILRRAIARVYRRVFFGTLPPGPTGRPGPLPMPTASASLGGQRPAARRASSPAEYAARPAPGPAAASVYFLIKGDSLPAPPLS